MHILSSNQFQDVLDDIETNGMVRLNFTNETSGIDFDMTFVEQSLVDKYVPDEVQRDIIRSIMHAVNNFSINHDVKDFNYYENLDPKKMVVPAVQVLAGILFIAIGILGLVKGMSDQGQKVVKYMRKSCHVSCMVIGSLFVFGEASNFITMVLAINNTHFEITNTAILLKGATGIVFKQVVTAHKLQTFFVYCFQIIMVYDPFYFREHKASLGRKLCVHAATGWLATLTAFTAWAVSIILGDNIVQCKALEGMVYRWNVSLFGVSCTAFALCALTSCIYILTYVWSNRLLTVQSSINRRINHRSTITSCVIELVYDISMLAYLVSSKGSQAFREFTKVRLYSVE